MNNLIKFPEGFILGAATSSYQIEGAVNAGGRGPSIWDHFCKKTGKVKNSDNGDIACDHYNRYINDVRLMSELGIKSYRFSIAWPRIFPSGTGTVNQPGLDFYDRLIDQLLAAGIEPLPTLFHWDLPVPLQDKIGGFKSKQCAQYFTDYSLFVADKFRDRVKRWITINEPWVYAMVGHLRGVHAPGLKSLKTGSAVLHHLMYAHGLTYRALKQLDSSLKVGITLNLSPCYPRTDSPKDEAAAVIFDHFFNRCQLEPLFRGRYAPQLVKMIRFFLPKFDPIDMKVIHSGMDFLGVNYYTRIRARHSHFGPLIGAWLSYKKPPPREYIRNGKLYTSMGWEIYPQGLYDLMIRLKNDYGNPEVYITENGAAFKDALVSGHIHDQKRIDYFHDHLAKLSKAIDAGANVKRYYAWSLMDNFEWEHGYSQRFGLYHVDYDTQIRTLKDSGKWYRELIKYNISGATV